MLQGSALKDPFSASKIRDVASQEKMGSSNPSFHGFDIFYSTLVLLPPVVYN